MANLGVLIETFNNIIGNQIEKKEILPATQAYKLSNFFFRNGNAGINALRELLEEMKGGILCIRLNMQLLNTTIMLFRMNVCI